MSQIENSRDIKKMYKVDDKFHKQIKIHNCGVKNTMLGEKSQQRASGKSWLNKTNQQSQRQIICNYRNKCKKNNKKRVRKATQIMRHQQANKYFPHQNPREREKYVERLKNNS